MQLLFEPVWGWFWTLLIAIGLLVFVLMTYPARVAHLSRRWRRILVGLRVATAVVLIFAMFRPVLRLTDEDTESVVVVVLADASRSMSVKDGARGESRRAELVELFDATAPLWKKLGKHVDLRRYDFSEGLEPLDSFADLSEGPQTAMGITLKQVLEDTRGKKVAAVFLHGDGGERSASARPVSPESIARKYGQQGISLYTTPYGATTSTGNIIDLALEDLLLEQVVFEKKTVPINLKLRAEGVAGRKLEVRLLVENRIGKRPGETGELVAVPSDSSNRTRVVVTTEQSSDVLPIQLTYTPKTAGEFLIAIEVKAVDGEVLLRNNRIQTLLTVRKGGLRVAYFDVLRSELKYLRRMNQSEKIQIDFQLVLSGEFKNRTKIPLKWFKPGEYDVYIIGDIPAKVFGPERLRQLSNRVREGAGLLMLGGYHTYGAGGYANTPLVDFLPVEMKPGEEQPVNKIEKSLQKYGNLKVVPTEAGLSHYVMLLDSPEKNAKRWGSLPTMSVVNKMKPTDDFVQVIATTEDGSPVLISSESGRSRIVASGMRETFLWAASGDNVSYQRFWRQMILWLAHKEFDSDQPVWVRIQPYNFPPETPVPIEMGAQTDKGTPIEDAIFKIEVSAPDGKKTPLSGVKSGKTSLAEFRKTALPGSYSVRVDATKGEGGPAISLPARARFIIDDRDIELDHPAADIAQLEALSKLAAETTDSRLIPPDKFQSFLRDYIAKKSWKSDMERSRRISLWDGWLVMLVFIGLLSVEWFLRKKLSLV